MSFVDFNKHPVPKFRRYISVRDQYEGFHKYENAPQEVAFLKNLHRHLFKVEATIEVTHNERELEFFMVKDVLKHQIMPFLSHSLDMGSCETQAQRILEGLINTYGPDRFYGVTVEEDGENGATVDYLPEEQEPRSYGLR
jgi:hypothetical protein